MEKDGALAEFRNLVGSVILLADPLSITSLSCLLGVDPHIIADYLDNLHSVLRVPSDLDSPVRLLHLSFREFLLDPALKDANPFWIDQAAGHTLLAARCLEILQGSLRRNMSAA